MARIRAIKPEFWSSPGIESADPYARLLYIAMWNWADDSGVGVANPRELLGFAFPLDEEITVADLRRMLVEIRRVFGVNFYTVAGRQYYYIPSWEKHQKFDRRSKGKYPGPDEVDEAEIPGNKGIQPHSTESHESTPSPRSNSVAGTGEQGNSGTEELKDLSAEPDEFDQWYARYPRKEAKESARKAFAKARRKTSLETLLSGLEKYKQTISGQERRFIALPASWLNAGRWEDETPDDTKPAANSPWSKDFYK